MLMANLICLVTVTVQRIVLVFLIPFKSQCLIIKFMNSLIEILLAFV